MNEQYELTEGERFLCEFFKSEGIKYETQKRLDNLKGDNKLYRIVDFYLPKFKMYVEFCGYWYVSDENKASYKEKMNVYIKNNIPCVYLYPENLGIIEYSFYYRLKKELKKHNLKKELSRYNLKLLKNKRGSSLLYLSISILLLIAFQFDKTAELYWQSCVTVGLIALYPLLRLVSFYYKYLDDKA